MLNVVVTGGGTIAPIDDVRHIANVSSGRFSSRTSEAFLRHGEIVTHLAPPSAILPFPPSVPFDLAADFDGEIQRIRSIRADRERFRDRLHLHTIEPATVEHYAGNLHAILKSQTIDIAVLAMAVSDYEPVPVPGKISSDRESWAITLQRSQKVIRFVKTWSPRTFLVGFKLLTGVPESHLIDVARRSCVTNDSDLTVANDLALYKAGRHTVHVVDRNGLIDTIGPGGDVAEKLVDRILTTYRARVAEGPAR